jgi:hypothetical protein
VQHELDERRADQARPDDFQTKACSQHAHAGGYGCAAGHGCRHL